MREDPIDVDQWMAENEVAMEEAWLKVVADFKAKYNGLPDEKIINSTKLGFQLGWMEGSEYHMDKVATVLQKMNFEHGD